MEHDDPMLSPIEGAQHQNFAGVEVDIMAAGQTRVKRLVYAVGGKWSTHIKPHAGTEFCMHAHVGFLAKGRLAGEYPDGCIFDFVAPIAVYIEPEHDSWVVGDQPAVLIQFDYERDTLERLGIPETHRH